jgi:dienelactone hydrolase
MPGASRRTPPLRILGADDSAWINEPAERLRAALVAAGATVDWQTLPGLAHALAEAPGQDPAPQTAAGKAVDAAVVAFLRKHLS